VVNDAILGLLAGSPEGWGLAVVAGTGCNCRGWDAQRRREGRVTGAGSYLGEGAGGSDLVIRALQAVAHAWTRRGPQTRLSQALVEAYHARDVEDLLEGAACGRIHPAASAAPRVFELAGEGDAAAIEVVRWAGQELGELVNAVIRQLGFEGPAAPREFDVVLVGGLFDAGPILVDPMQETIHALAPGARLVRLSAPPVVGAVLLAMQHAGHRPGGHVRETLIKTLTLIHRKVAKDAKNYGN
jgi:N-acetylglucosamine kinase-like BadF-type ATPase